MSDGNTDAITIRGIRALGYHGVYEHERRSGQPFVVDLVLHLDLSDAAVTDDVGDTVHYGELAQKVVGAIETEPVDLIETLARRIADLALAHPRIDRVEVTVHKPEAPVGAVVDDIAVTISRTRR